MTILNKTKDFLTENTLFCAEMALLFIVALLAPWLTALHKRRMIKIRVKIREEDSGNFDGMKNPTHAGPLRSVWGRSNFGNN